jgi:hypothetical protein
VGLTRKQSSQFPKRGLDQLVEGGHTRCAFESARGIEGKAVFPNGELREFGRVGRRSGRLDTDWGEPYLRSRLSLRLAPRGGKRGRSIWSKSFDVTTDASPNSSSAPGGKARDC